MEATLIELFKEVDVMAIDDPDLHTIQEILSELLLYNHHHHHHQGMLMAQIPLTLSTSIPINHHSWQVFKTASSVCIKLMIISFCWSANTDVYILLPRYINKSTNFRGWLFTEVMAPSWLKHMNFILPKLLFFWCSSWCSCSSRCTCKVYAVHLVVNPNSKQYYATQVGKLLNILQLCLASGDGGRVVTVFS